MRRVSPRLLLIPAVFLLGCGGKEEPPGSRYSDRLRSADLRWSQGRAEEVRNILSEILEEDESAFWARYRMGAILVDTDPGEAESHLARAAALDPEHPGPPFFTGCARYSVNDYRGGDAAMTTAYRLSQSRRGYSLAETTETVALGLAALEQNRLAEALQAFTRALETEDSEPVLWYLYGIANLAVGGLAEAGRGADRALELAPDLAPALVLKSRVLLESGDREGSWAAVDRALARAPDLGAVRYQRGLLRLQDNEYRAGVLEFWQAVLFDPLQAEPHEALGRALMRVEMMELGAQQLQHAEWLHVFLGRYLGRPGFTPSR